MAYLFAEQNKEIRLISSHEKHVTGATLMSLHTQDTWYFY